MLEKVLSDKEIAEVQKFIKNDCLKEAVKKILLYGIYYNGTLKKGEEPNPMMNFALTINEIDGKMLTDEEIGAVLRAKRHAIEMLVTGYQELEKFDMIPAKETKKGNQAR